MQIVVFVVSAVISLVASVLLVARIARVGERLGLSEALLGLVAALAADGPEITSSITAIATGNATVGVGVTLGSNVFNLAALLGLAALVAGRIRFHRRVIVLEGALGLWIAVVALATVAGNIAPTTGLLAGLIAFVPYLALSAAGPTTRLRVRLPRGWSAWLARAFSEEEFELDAAIHPRRGDWRDAVVAVVAVAVVIAASAAMEQAATDLGPEVGLSEIVVGGLILAAVTSVPNAVAGVYLASRGRGAAALSTAFNSNALNVIVGLLLPATLLGIGGSTDDRVLVVGGYALMTAGVVVLATRARGFDRRSGAVIVAGYLVFAALLAVH